MPQLLPCGSGELVSGVQMMYQRCDADKRHQSLVPYRWVAMLSSLVETSLTCLQWEREEKWLSKVQAISRNHPKMLEQKHRGLACRKKHRRREY